MYPFFIGKKNKTLRWGNDSPEVTARLKTVNTTAWLLGSCCHLHLAIRRNTEDSKALLYLFSGLCPLPDRREVAIMCQLCVWFGWFHTLLPTDNHIKTNMHAMENSTLPFVNSTNAALLVLQPCGCVFFCRLRGKCSWAFPLHQTDQEHLGSMIPSDPGDPVPLGKLPLMPADHSA